RGDAAPDRSEPVERPRDREHDLLVLAVESDRRLQLQGLRGVDGRGATTEVEQPPLERHYGQHELGVRGQVALRQAPRDQVRRGPPCPGGPPPPPPPP